MKKESLTGIGLILFCIALAVVVLLDSQSKERKIHNWAAEQGYQVQEIQESHFSNGPFTIKDENQRIYRARVYDGRSHKWIWFRIGWWVDAKEE